MPLWRRRRLRATMAYLGFVIVMHALNLVASCSHVVSGSISAMAFTQLTTAQYVDALLVFCKNSMLWVVLHRHMIWTLLCSLLCFFTVTCFTDVCFIWLTLMFGWAITFITWAALQLASLRWVKLRWVAFHLAVLQLIALHWRLSFVLRFNWLCFNWLCFDRFHRLCFKGLSFKGLNFKGQCFDELHLSCASVSCASTGCASIGCASTWAVLHGCALRGIASLSSLRRRNRQLCQQAVPQLRCALGGSMSLPSTKGQLQ